MSTEAQIIANRRNAQKSTGPRSTRGKAIVSQNALKHGLWSSQTVIRSESQSDFELFRNQILTELSPQTPIESILVERIVDLSWRLKRINRIHTQTIDALNKPDTPGPLLKLTQSLFQKNTNFSQTPQPAPAEELALGRMAIKDFSNARVLDRLLMYERRTEHSLFKTHLEFLRLRLMRNMENPNTSEQDFKSWAS